MKKTSKGKSPIQNQKKLKDSLVSEIHPWIVELQIICEYSNISNVLKTFNQYLYVLSRS